ncbi:PREDICTED: caricain-like, partial [Lupinus angustifolius]
MAKFAIFKANLNYIIEFNAIKNSPSSYTLGLNKFADWSEKEVKETYLSCLDTSTDSDMPTDNVIELDRLPQPAPPLSLDWRVKGAVTNVKNQESCYGCWAFSTIGGIEGINAIDTKKFISLSLQQLIDCDTTSKGCKGGSIMKGLDWVIKNGG